MTQDEIIEMANEAGIIQPRNVIKTLEAFAKLVEEHVRRTMSDEAKAHLEELRKNFDTESAELRLHKWTKAYESPVGHMFGDKK
jgi:glutamate synthase domain-containing protein 3